MEDEKPAEEKKPSEEEKPEKPGPEDTGTAESLPEAVPKPNETTTETENKKPAEEANKTDAPGKETTAKNEAGKSPRTSLDQSEKQNENKRLSLEYTEIVIEISDQNKVLRDLKQRLIELANQSPSVRSASELRGIRCCLEQEKTKLKCLVQRAAKFQIDHPSGPWEDIPLETNISEDCMPSRKYNSLCTALCKRIDATKRKMSSKGK